jgi:hypothetical protein
VAENLTTRLVTALITVVVVLISACGSSSSTSTHETTLRLHGTHAGVEQGSSGTFQRETYSAPLTDSSGAKAGRADVFCTSTANPSLDLCTATLVLRRGTVSAQGLIGHVDGHGTLSLDGGTGAYTDAGGSVRAINLNGSDERLALHIVTR